MDKLNILVAFTGGIFSFFSPCIFPLIPSYILYIAGITFKDFSEEGDSIQIRKQAVINSLFFILGFSMIFILLGAALSFLGQILFLYRDLIRIVGSIIIIALGLYIIGVFKLPFLDLEHKMHLRSKPAGYFGSFLVGITFAVAWVPCVGPILGSIFILASTSETVGSGVLLLAFYSLGLAVPFLITAWLFNSVFVYFKNLTKYLGMVKTISGIFVVLIGVLILTDYIRIIAFYLINWTGFGGI